MSEDLDDIIDNLREPSSWIRIIFMVGFAIISYLIIAPIVLVLMIVQALFSVITGDSNANLRRFGQALSEYFYQILRYLTYNESEKPFPFSDFPVMDPAPQARSPASQGNRPNKPAAGKTSGEKTSSRAAQSAARKRTASKKVASKKTASRKSASRKKAAGSTSTKPAAAKKTTAEKKPGPADNKTAAGAPKPGTSSHNAGQEEPSAPRRGDDPETP